MTEASAGQRRSPVGNGVPRLDARGITKRFGRLTVLRDVSLRIGPGEVVALVGENGAGKSSLVACIARILEPEEGEVRLDGAPLPSTPDQVRQAGVEVLWQDHGLCDDLDVVANVFLGRERGRWVIAESQMREDAASVLRRVGAETLPLDRPVRGLSRGQRQLVALGRVLMSAPRLVLLDEPTAALGVAETLRVQGVIRRCRDAGAGILLVTHDLDQVFALADRVVVLRDGRVVADVSPLEVHRDDIVALMSGIEMDSMARRQLQRLRSLVDQLSDVEPAASLPLIVSAMAAALDQEMLCVHLLDAPDGGHAALHRRAAVGLPAPLLEVNDRLELGVGRRLRGAGRRGGRGRRRRGPVHAPGARALPASGGRVGHPQRVGRADRRHPRRAGDGVGLRHRGRPARAGPARAGAPLPGLRGGGHRTGAAAGRGLPAQPHPRVAARDARDAGRARPGGGRPGRVAAGVEPSARRGRGRGADRAGRCAGRPGDARRRHRRPRRPASSGSGPAAERILADDVDAGARFVEPDLAAVALRHPDGRAVLVAHLPAGDTRDRRRPRAARRRHPLARAGHGGRGPRARPTGGRRPAALAGHPARAPVVAQPRAPHAAHRHPGLRVDAAPARPHLGRRVDRPVPPVDRQRGRPAGAARGRPARLDAPSSRGSCDCSATGATSRWWSRRPCASWRDGSTIRVRTDADLEPCGPTTTAWSRCSSTCSRTPSPRVVRRRRRRQPAPRDVRPAPSRWRSATTAPASRRRSPARSSSRGCGARPTAAAPASACRSPGGSSRPTGAP